MGLGRQLGRAFGSFGKQLSRGAGIFGRQVVNTVNDISSGINQAQKVVSQIESATQNIPVLGSATSALNSGLKTAGNVASLVGLGGQSLRDVATGNYSNLQKDYQTGNSLLGSLGSNIASGLASGTSAVVQAGL